MKSFKKLLSTFLSALMVISMINLPAKALETQGTNNIVPKNWTTIAASHQMSINDVDYQRAVQQRMAEKFGLTSGEGNESQKSADVQKLDPDDNVRVIVELNGQSTFEMAKSQKIAFSQASKFESKVDAIQKPVIEKAKAYGKIRHTYKSLFNGFSLTVKYGDIEKIKGLPGVKNVKVANLYQLDINNAREITNATDVWNDYGINGEGTVVAIIDTGIDYTHRDMKLTDPSKAKLTEADVQEMIKKDPNHLGQYFTEKVPFGYNFADMNNIVIDRTSSMHGMHVAGIVGANGDTENGGVKGVAPEAQLLAMKVFTNNPDFPSAYNDDVAAAIESSVLHGADVINMSLGSTAGFIDPEDIEQKAIKNATDAGVVVVVSAGNSYYSTQGGLGYSLLGYGLSYPEDPDIGVVGAPGLYDDTIQVASYENTNITTSALNYKDGIIPYYMAGSVDPVKAFSGPVEYVDCKLGLIGTSNGTYINDFNGVDLNGKIALIQRGAYPGIDGLYVDKIMNAQNHGAVGVIIYNSAAGGDVLLNIAYPDDTGYIPAVFIGLTNGQKLKSLIGTKENYVEFKGEKAVINNPTSGQMSDYSSWGSAPGLEFKPEVTAPGGNIYSTVNKDSYETMSGTSMAAPHTAGAVALVVQRLKKDGVELSGRNFVALAKTLLVNSSEPLIDPSTMLPYLTRYQGAGLIQIDKAVKTNAYVTDASGSPTVALKEIGNATNFELTIKNFGNEDLTFVPSGNYGVLTNALYSNYYLLAKSRVLKGAEIKFDKNEIVVPAKGEAVLNVTLNIPKSAVVNNFAEGFITLTEKDGKNPSLGIPYMGFYGKWSGQNGPRMFDAPLWDFDNVYYSGSTLIDPDGYYLGYEGRNEYGYPIINPDHIAFSPNGDYYRDNVSPYFNLMRNAKEFKVQIIDSKGNVIREISYDEYMQKNYINASVNNSSPRINSDWDWDGRIYNPITNRYETAAEGSYTVRIMAKPDFENAEWYTLDMPVKLDITEPQVSAKGEKLEANEYRIKLESSSDGEGSGIAYYYVAAVDENGYIIEYYELQFNKDGETVVTIPNTDFTMLILAEDYAGNMGASVLDLNVNNDSVTIEPIEYYNNTKDITISYSINDLLQPVLDHVAIVLDGGMEINNEKNLSYELKNIADGYHTVAVRLYSTDGKNIGEESAEFVVDTTKPVINILNPATSEVFLTNGESQYTIRMNVNDNILLNEVYVGEETVYQNLDGYYEYTVNLSQGVTKVNIKAIDMAGNISKEEIVFNNNIEKPIIRVNRPYDNETITGKKVRVEGSVIYKSGIDISEFTINGKAVELDDDNNFSTDVEFEKYGKQIITIKAKAPAEKVEKFKNSQVTTPIEKIPGERQVKERPEVKEPLNVETPIQNPPIKKIPIEKPPIEVDGLGRALVQDEQPLEETPVGEVSTEETPVEETPVEEVTGEEAPAEEVKFVESTVDLEVVLSPFEFEKESYNTNQSEFTVNYSVDTTDTEIDKVQISYKDKDYEQAKDATSFEVKELEEGDNIISFKALNADGVVLATHAIAIHVDKTYPTVSIFDQDWNNISEGYIYNTHQISITGFVSEKLEYLRINGIDVEVNEDWMFSMPLTLEDGMNRVTIQMKDMAGNENEYQFKAWVDDTAPEIVVEKPDPIVVADNEIYTIMLKVKDDTFGYKVYVNGNQIAYDENGMGLGTEWNEISYDYTVPEGKSTLLIEVKDMAGNSVDKQYTFYRNYDKPILLSESVSYDKLNPQDILINTEFNGYTVTKVSVGDRNLTIDTDYSILDNSILLKKEFVQTLPNGENMMRIRFEKISETSGTIEILNYLINVKDSRSNDALLKDLKVGGKTIEGFDPQKFNYIYEVSPLMDTIPEVEYELNNISSTAEVNKATKAGEATTIKVTAQDGTINVYRVNFVIPLAIERISTQTEYQKGNQAIVKFRATNQTDRAKYATLILGLYNEEGALVNFVTGGYTVKVGESVDMSAAIATPNADGYTIKCFVWDSIDGMIPLSKAIEFPVK